MALLSQGSTSLYTVKNALLLSLTSPSVQAKACIRVTHRSPPNTPSEPEIRRAAIAEVGSEWKLTLQTNPTRQKCGESPASMSVSMDCGVLSSLVMHMAGTLP